MTRTARFGALCPFGTFLPALPMLGTRILTALILIPLVLAAMFLLPPLGFGTFALGAVAVAAVEWARLGGFDHRRQALFAALVVGLGIVAMLVPAVGFGASGWPARALAVLCAPALAFWLLVAPLWLRANYRPASVPAMALVGVVVLVGTWAAVVQLQAGGPWLALAAMAVVWIADIAAYFAGRAFGRRKLAPAISPGKTWEGVYGALAAVAVYALLLTSFAPRAGLSSDVTIVAIATFVAIVLGLALLSIEGDLFESLLKRRAGVKDSGTLLPGHGGVLDRIDALTSSMPAAAFLAQVFLK
jgi:phosphatidate cytidylyltransferase